MRILLLLLILLSLSLAGCAGTPSTPPPAQQTVAPEDNDPRQLAAATQDEPAPGLVRWGGRVETVTAVPQGLRLVVRAYPLDADGRPRLDQPSPGRFTAVLKPPPDPGLFAPGRTVTVIGSVSGRTKDGQPLLEARYYQPAPAGKAVAAQAGASPSDAPAPVTTPPAQPRPQGGWRFLWPSLFLGWGFNNGWIGFSTGGGWSAGYIHE